MATLQCMGAEGLPYTLEACPLCSAPGADLCHYLMHCSGTLDLVDMWATAVGFIRNTAEFRDYIVAIFQGHLGHPLPNSDHAAARIQLIADIFHRVVQATELKTSIAELIASADVKANRPAGVPAGSGP